MTPGITLQSLGADINQADLADLIALLIDCVEGGASVGFMLPLPEARTEAFWRRKTALAASGDHGLLVARDAGGKIIGTVQVVLAQPENQPHRGDIIKLLVHRGARRLGVGEALMRAAQVGKTLLVLDTATGSAAERLYTRLGWRRVGVIPDYALYPDGRLTATTVYYLQLK
ncbi:GCN5-related N-acetyltransferase [Candidatus Sodalis pierantonius str. SOPE]|uniref:GCN5-related N-acetyltransferase n=1 Tax=Candidatus Sodalis pierantonii str. SOPE TaxID=2342 RepID=W0HQ87_9GAMM|nr:GNAT family N-acetyltransferase [Candidatus Sodalis pierantonius]AHF74677.1 GCN5-related N-acetyltransferase [Candidatus Sodalis pierantonius str. SOPE]